MSNSNKYKKLFSDTETSFILERIIDNGNHIAQLSYAFVTYTYKAKQLTDKTFKIIQALKIYAESKYIYASLQSGMINVSMCMEFIAELSDHRTEMIHNNVLKELNKYEHICDNTRENIKEIQNARSSENLSKRELEKIKKDSPGNKHRILQAEIKLSKASENVSQIILELEEQMIDFERSKIHSIKKSLLEFINAEIAYHARALTVLDKTRTKILQVNEENDVQEFTDIVIIQNTKQPGESNTSNPTSPVKEQSFIAKRRNKQNIASSNTNIFSSDSSKESESEASDDSKLNKMFNVKQTMYIRKK